MAEVLPQSIPDVGVGAESISVVGTALDVTVIMVTSPVRSNPATLMLEQIMDGIDKIQALRGCKRVLVCDGCPATDIPVTHHNKCQAKRATKEDSDKYDAFKANCRTMAATGAFELIELPERAGFGPAVRTALEKAVSTPFVFVVQHDMLIVRDCNAKQILGVMATQPDVVKYVALPSVSTLHAATAYREATKGALHDIVIIDKIVPQTSVDKCDEDSGIDQCGTKRKEVESGVDDGVVGGTGKDAGAAAAAGGGGAGAGATEAQSADDGSVIDYMALAPLQFFYDAPHFCSKAHYMGVIFGRDTLIKKYDFIEETYGKVIREDMRKNGPEAHAKHGTYQMQCRCTSVDAVKLLPVVVHINGRFFLTPEQRVARGWPAQQSSHARKKAKK